MPRFVAYLFLLAACIICFQAEGGRLFAESVVQPTKAPVESGQVAGESLEKGAEKNRTSEEGESDAADAAKEDSAENGKSESKDSADNDQDSEENKTDEKEKEAKTEEKKESAKKAAEKAKPFKVKSKPLKVETKLDGYFVADEMVEVALRPEAWTKFKVLEAVAHGTHVEKGEVLVRFDPEDLEKALEKESIEQRLSELALMQAEEEHPREKKLAEINFDAAKRSNKQFKEDFEYYQSTERPFFVEIAHYRHKAAQEQLAAAREELPQLQQMYEADELTEETEEIVLRRQRFAVETAELVMELNTANRDYTLNVSLPRRDEFFRNALEASEISLAQAKTGYETGIHRRVYEMEKRRQARALSVERHAKLLSDKGLMEIRAPTDGVVYYGRCLDGKWSEVSSMQTKLKPFGTASAKSVLMTIVKPRPLHVESSFGEKDLPDLSDGLTAIIHPVADEELELSGKVAKLEAVPGKSNKFKIQLEVDNQALPGWLVAGMTCKANVTTYHNKNALQVPNDLVQTDEDDKKKKYVMLVDPEKEEPVRRRVKLGHKQGKMVEVLEGLEEGDEIVKEEKKDESDK
ncbi:MAG: hypothetical protein MI725_06255 [Pirellulales bacterium]|nr:hypothetical protein [Pirellulales bacterium]